MPTETQKNKDISELKINTLKKAHKVIRSVNHPLRMKILELLQKKLYMSVTDIYKALNLEQSVASQQLAIMRNCNVLDTVRTGKSIHYQINYDTINKVAFLSHELSKFTKII